MPDFSLLKIGLKQLFDNARTSIFHCAVSIIRQEHGDKPERNSMRRVILSNMAQAVYSKGFVIATLGMMTVLLLSSLEGLLAAFRSNGLLAYSTHTQMLLSAFSTDGAMLALPILCTLPYTTAYVDDVKSGYIKAYLPRMKLNWYITGKTLSCALSGGLSLLLGVVIAYIILVLLLMPMETIGKPEEGQVIRLVEKLSLVFVSGAFWSLIGFLLASLTKSRYMAYAGPFVICYVLIIMYERYFDKLYVLYPREWLNPSDKWVMGAWGSALLLLTLCVVIASIFALWSHRKLVEA